MIDAHRKAFIEEAIELLTELESSLLELENDPDNADLIAKVFRALHTIKGSSGMFGYDDISMFTHDIENVYDHIRNGELKITKEIIDLTLAARDQISLMLIQTDEAKTIDEELTREILASFRGLVNRYNENATKETPAHQAEVLPLPQVPDRNLKAFFVSFKPENQIFLSGTNPVLLINELHDLGKVILVSYYNNIPEIPDINPEYCYTYWNAVLTTKKTIDSIKDIFIFIEDQCELSITELNDVPFLLNDEGMYSFENRINETMTNDGFDLRTCLNEFKLEAGIETDDKSKKSRSKNKENAETQHEHETASSIRVSAEKLDELVNLVGELVTTQARLNQIALLNQDANLDSVAEEVERITWSLRDSALNIRMLPIGTTFSKFNRLVRDLTKDLGKEVVLTTEGGETELDKTVIEKLNDPLVHIIRNSIDHGVEMPADRIKAGKPAAGKVLLSATQSGGNVIIKIIDDGAGMNKDAIRNKAIKQGLTTETAELSDNEIFSFIFAAGFSTAQKVTSVSGRGVGMDVVKRAIEALRGTVEVTSEEGKGTTIILKLPLTLAIIDGLLVKIEDDFFILPLSSIEECIELSQADIDNAHGRHIVNIRENLVPYISLRQKFEMTSQRPPIEQVVVASLNGSRIGFVVDQVFGQHQTVLKSLGSFYKNVEGVSGATILGDGTVALILDIKKLFENEEIEETNNNNFQSRRLRNTQKDNPSSKKAKKTGDDKSQSKKSK